MRHAVALLICLAGCLPALADVSIQAPTFTATVRGGVLCELRSAGQLLVTPGELRDQCGLRRVAGEHWVQGEAGEAVARDDGTTSQVYRDLSDLPGSELRMDYLLDGEELAVVQTARSPLTGVRSVQWGLAEVPFAYDVIVPGYSGIRIRKLSPGSRWDFTYPIGWEAQLVILQGQGHGFYVWAEDADGRYKRLTVTRGKSGWRLAFATENNAPFAPCTEATSVRWRLGVHQGDWRVAARRYRDWTERTWGLTRLEDQSPSWVRDIRFVVITGQDRQLLQDLAGRVDPRQTLLYIPGWRRHGYDRMYPDYTANDDFSAFVTDAHALGFRVMPHVNYFGCDPKSPEYAQFEPYQVRNPETHEKEWWLWERADPVIKFAYINPAHKPWRDLFVTRMKELVDRYKVDALHLDQTLCIYNDDNGLMDGMTMLQGNVALHRELRAALPQVALSGEGLDEVTMRYEAFAQRHAWGLDFINGTWDRKTLAMAHPVSSYLFLNFTQPYGYLGMTSPTKDQLYAAWRENYKHWGVIPTLSSYGALPAEPPGFLAQVLDEAAAFTQHRLSPDLEGDWPEDVFFPYRGADGATAAYRDTSAGTVFTVSDGQGEREVSRTVSGVRELSMPGSIPGWRCYDGERIFGLDPERWYAYSPQPRDLSVFHVSGLPEGFTVSRVAVTETAATVEVTRPDDALAWIADLLPEATSGSIPDAGPAFTQTGPLDSSPDGASFTAMGRDIHAHPPWKGQGSGRAYATMEIDVPALQGAVWFRAQVAMDSAAIGPEKTDGVLFRVAAQAEGQDPVAAEVLNATADRQPLDLDLTALAGKRVRLTLSVDPGPRRSPSFDWARWYRPRIEVERSATGVVALAHPPPYRVAVSGAGELLVGEVAGTVTRFTLNLPGAVILLRQEPAAIALPLDLTQQPFALSFVSEAGEQLNSPQYAGGAPAEATVGGVTRRSLGTHPPDHGTTCADYVLRLPELPAQFQCFVGLRNGSKSEGCGFRVTVNGQTVAYRKMLPGQWEAMSADLSAWAGQPILLSLVTDSEGGFDFDWAAWGEPRLVALP